MQSVTLNQFCRWTGDPYHFFLTETLEGALEADRATTDLKKRIWVAINHHFLKGNVDFSPFREQLFNWHKTHFEDTNQAEDFLKIVNLCNNPESLRRYHLELKILKVIAVVGALIFFAASILAFIKLHYNYLNIPISHLHLIGIGIGIFTLALIIRKCYKIQSTKTELHEAYNELWKPIFNYIYGLPKEVLSRDIIKAAQAVMPNSCYYLPENVLYFGDKTNYTDARLLPEQLTTINQKGVNCIKIALKEVSGDFEKWNASFIRNHTQPSFLEPHEEKA